MTLAQSVYTNLHRRAAARVTVHADNSALTTHDDSENGSTCGCSTTGTR